MSKFMKWSAKMLFIGGNDAKINRVQTQPSPFWGENNDKIYLK